MYRTYKKYEDLEKDYGEQKLHPGDLKPAVVKYINMLLEPVRQHFKKNEYAKGLLEKVIQYREEDRLLKEKLQKEAEKATKEGKKGLLDDDDK